MKKLFLLVLVLFILLGCSPSISVITPGKVSLSLDGTASTWAISDGKYLVSNIKAGDKVLVPLKIYNYSSFTKNISISVKVPNSVEKDYLILPLDWVIVNDSQVQVPANSSVSARVWLFVPKDYKVVSKNFEVWVAFKDLDQKGMAKAEFCSKILVRM